MSSCFAPALFLLPQAEAEPGLEEESPALAARVESTRERTPSFPLLRNSARHLRQRRGDVCRHTDSERIYIKGRP